MRALLLGCVLAFVSGCNCCQNASAPAPPSSEPASSDGASSDGESCGECCTPASRAAVLRQSKGQAPAPAEHQD